MYRDAFELEDDDEPIILSKTRNIKLEKNIKENIIDTKTQQSRPRGPRNKRPPNPANRRQKAEQGQSPIEDNPPPPIDDKVNFVSSLSQILNLTLFENC